MEKYIPARYRISSINTSNTFSHDRKLLHWSCNYYHLMVTCCKLRFNFSFECRPLGVLLFVYGQNKVAQWRDMFSEISLNLGYPKGKKTKIVLLSWEEIIMMIQVNTWTNIFQDLHQYWPLWLPYLQVINIIDNVILIYMYINSFLKYII